jgi:hypothetical protein
MALDNISSIARDHLRLPDALTVRHGSGPLIAKFVLEGDRAARAAGIHLYLRNDFDAFVQFNERETAAGRWYPLTAQFNPKYADIGPGNGFWIAGENDAGETVAASAGRVFDWRSTNLAEQKIAVFYGRDEGQPCTMTAEAAQIALQIRGFVLSAGATWVRPDYRGRELSQLMPRMARAYSLSRWPLDWTIGFVPRALADNGIASGYGAKHLAYSFFYPLLRWSELVLTYTSGSEAYDDFGGFLDAELSEEAGGKFATARSLSSKRLHPVTSVSPDAVRHGSMSRS